MGTNTKMGTLSNTDMVTAFLRVLDEIGTDILITTHASGGIAHPKMPGDRIPFENLPQIALITNQIDEAFHNPLTGALYDKYRARFHGPKYADKELMANLEEGLMVSHGLSPLERLVYYTSNTSPEYEDPAYIQKVIVNGGGAFGMSVGPEKRVIDDCINIKRFINLAVVTNPVRLRFKGGNAELMDVRRKINSFGWHIPTNAQEFRSRKKSMGLWERTCTICIRS